MLKKVYDDNQVALWHGDSSQYEGDADFIFTNPYADLPVHLRKRPMLICDFADRHATAEGRCGTVLRPISPWFGGRNMIWAGNIEPLEIDLSDLKPDGIFFPEELVRRLLEVYGVPGEHVWDGFMGRGTVGKVCREMGMMFTGIDKSEEMINHAREYVCG